MASVGKTGVITYECNAVSGGSNEMQRQAWLLRIKAGKEKAYREAHANVWPELISASMAAGFQNHSVFVEGNAIIAYLEADDLEAATLHLKGNPIVDRWNEAMASLLEETTSSPFEEVFHFD